jgi:hypothetical protein
MSECSKSVPSDTPSAWLRITATGRVPPWPHRTLNQAGRPRSAAVIDGGGREGLAGACGGSRRRSARQIFLIRSSVLSKFISYDYADSKS